MALPLQPCEAVHNLTFRRRGKAGVHLLPAELRPEPVLHQDMKESTNAVIEWKASDDHSPVPRAPTQYTLHRHLRSVPQARPSARGVQEVLMPPDIERGVVRQT
eukprot:762521-Hanusia_phi.AAC.27